LCLVVHGSTEPFCTPQDLGKPLDFIARVGANLGLTCPYDRLPQVTLQRSYGFNIVKQHVAPLDYLGA